MATMRQYRTARIDRPCDEYPRCHRGIKSGERYLRAVATPNDSEVNQSPHWWTLSFCREHMQPEQPTGAADKENDRDEQPCEHGVTHAPGGHMFAEDTEWGVNHNWCPGAAEGESDRG